MTKPSRWIALLAAILGCVATIAPTQADTLNCENLYIGRIWVEKGQTLYGAVFLNDPGDTSGSYWQFFVDWTPDDRKALLALLMSAKLTGHRVNVTTEAADGCGIQVSNQIVRSVFLANNP